VNDFKYFDESWNDPLSREQLIKRGKCCSLGCSNCPYTKPREKGNTKIEEK
jgi:hypothetical protein